MQQKIVAARHSHAAESTAHSNAKARGLQSTAVAMRAFVYRHIGKLAKHYSSLRLEQISAVVSFALSLARDDYPCTDIDKADVLVPVLVPLALAHRVALNVNSWHAT